jgi:hypothetical protein
MAGVMIERSHASARLRHGDSQSEGIMLTKSNSETLLGVLVSGAARAAVLRNRVPGRFLFTVLDTAHRRPSCLAFARCTSWAALRPAGRAC